MSETTELTPVPAHGTQIAKAGDSGSRMFVPANLDVPIEQVPDLDNAKVAPFDLMTEYLTPENKGDSWRVFFSHIENVDYPNQATGEVKALPTAFFMEKRKTEQGVEMVMMCNASARLVGRLQSYHGQGMVVTGTPLIITYLGKKKNSTNAYLSDDWSIKPLIIYVTPGKE